MTTIGYATLQIIPSLKGVSEAIEKQLGSETVQVAVEPKVDQAAAKKAGKETGDAIVKETTEAVKKGDVGKVIAEDVKKSTKGVGTQAGEAIAKETKDAVKKADVGKEVAKDVQEKVKKASPGRDIARVIVDGLAEGVKQGLPRGGVGEVIVDGLADGVKRGIDTKGLGGQIIGSISNAMKSGDLGGKLKDGLLPGIKGLGALISDQLTGGIDGATTQISASVLATTDTIAGIGEMFGLQTDSIRQFGTDASGLIGEVNDAATPLRDAIGVVGADISDLPNKTSQAVGLMNKAFAGIQIAQIGEQINMQIQAALEKNFPRLADLNNSNTPDQLGAQFREWLLGDGAKGNPVGPQLTTGGIPDSQSRAPATTRDSGGVPIAIDPITKLPLDQSDRPRRARGGQITGPGTGISDSILARVSNGEYVVNADATRKHLSLLEIINSGDLPGFAGGGLVAGTAQLRDVIKERFGISNIGGYRPGGDGFNEHSTGRALDVMVGRNKSAGDAVKDFVLQNASAIDLKWAIWRQHLYYAGGGGYDMPDRGSPTDNHMDHVHIFSGPGITNGLRGALKGSGAERGDSAGMLAALGVGGPGAIAPASTDTTAASVPPVAATAGGGASVPSTLSGLSSFGLGSVGSGVGATKSGSDLGVFGQAAEAAVSGQVSSALGVLGVGNSPGWLQAASKLIGGISVSDSSGNQIFSGSNLFGAGASAAPASAAPIGAGPPPPAAGGTVHGAGQGRTPGPVYNIRTATVEDAFLRAQRIENEKRAAKLSHL